MQRHLKVLLASLIAVAVLPTSAAEPPEQPAAGTTRRLLQAPKTAIASPITDRFALRAVFYRPDIRSALRYDSSTGVPGTPVTGEGTLGFPAQPNQFSVDMTFRMLERHRIHADFYKMTRSGDRVINQQIRFGDDVYQANDRVVSSMDLRKLGLTYTYSFYRSEKLEVGAGLALHLLQLDGSLAVPARFERERVDVAGPFATVSADAAWRVTRRFSLNVAGSYLGGTSGDVKGSFRSWHGDVQFRAHPNLAFGLGYTNSRFRIDSTDADFTGYLNLQYKGPEAFVRVSF